MSIEVCKGIEIINYDDKELENIKKTCTFDNGATQVLEALSFLIDDLIDRYEYESDIPYRKIFDVLKHVIQGACDKEAVRNALLTGLVVQKQQPKEKEVVPVQRIEQKEIKQCPQRKRHQESVSNQNLMCDVDKKAFVEYAKNHTVLETAKHFNVSYQNAFKYIYIHKVEHKKDERRSPYLEKIKKLAKDNLTCTEIANILGCTKVNVHKVAKRYNIKLYKKEPSKKK